MMSIDMIQKGMSEQEVNKELASKFKSTMAVVEKHVLCMELLLSVVLRSPWLHCRTVPEVV